MSAISEVRVLVRELQNTIRTSKDSSELVKCLKEVNTFLPVHSKTKCKETEASLIFMKNHYAKFAHFLLNQISFETIGNVSQKEFSQHFLYYLLEGDREDAFLAITHSIYSTGPGYKLNKCVTILEEYIKNHKLLDILMEQSGLNKDADTSLMLWKTDGRAILWESLITEMASLPDKTANTLKTEVSDLFLRQHYIPLLTREILRTLATSCRYIRLSKDCHLEFISHLVGKLCLCGYADQFWDIVLKQICGVIRKDYIWSRVCERVVTGVPDRCIESVLVPLVKSLPWYGLMDRFLGNCVTQNQKIQLLLCTKLVFHRYFKSPQVLQNIIGYLATAAPRQHLYIKLLFELIQVWGDQSSLNHTSYEQHYYITEALIICMAFIPGTHKQEHRDDILRLLMNGVQTHIGCSQPKVRRIGMLVAEVVTATIDPDGPKLNFEYEKDEEILSLKGLLLPPDDPIGDDIPEELSILLSDHLSNLQLEGLDDNIILTGLTCGGGSSDQTLDTHKEPTQSDTPATHNPQQTASDLDSDDDLEPYDMSHDSKVSKVKQPKYIRDCMEGLIGCDNPDMLEACLSVAETLIRANPGGLREVSVEMTKVLLHLTEGFSISTFSSMRFNALVALAVTCPRQVAEYMTEQFYDKNYSIRQRLDIIEVIGTAAQELSRPVDFSKKSKSKERQKVEEMTRKSDEPESWRDVVQSRIDSKTRRFCQGRSKDEPQPMENRFAPVAGYFFYPLLKNFDRQENTFDLMGEDCYVLGRLMYTLGIVMYAASNTNAVRQMAVCLLEFIWVLRFHSEASVRQGLLFAISMVYLAVPSHTLLGDLQQEVFESKNWLEDVIDKDVDTQCKTLAVQALVLLENIIKQEFLMDSEKI